MNLIGTMDRATMLDRVVLIDTRANLFSFQERQASNIQIQIQTLSNTHVKKIRFEETGYCIQFVSLTRLISVGLYCVLSEVYMKKVMPV